MTKQTYIVIPSHIPLTPMFLETLPENFPIILVHDYHKPYSEKLPKHIRILNHTDQQKLLGQHFQGYLPFRGSSACRIIGHLLAYQEGANVIMLDHDCFPKKDFIQHHLNALNTIDAPALTSSSGWINPLLSDQWYSRGFPYEYRHSSTLTTSIIKSAKVVAHMGLWENVLDINGSDKVKESPPKEIKLDHPLTLAKSMLPISGMNTALLNKVIPAYLLLPNIKLHNWTISRHDDIWGGYILKRLIDKKGDHLSFGQPIVYHAKESDQSGVLYHEHFIHLLNPHFHQLVDQAIDSTAKDTYHNMIIDFSQQFSLKADHATHLPPHYQKVFKDISTHLTWWSTLLNTR